MKFYVSVDMEGIGGIVLREQLVRGETLYEEARRLLTQEMNTVVDALAELNPEDIVVKDAHGRGLNFCIEDLSANARYVLGASRMDHRFPGIDSSFDGALLVGYHAMAGTSRAIRDHTMTSLDWQRIELNDQPIGEIGLDALIFGVHDVPVVFVSGDDKTCQEAVRELGPVGTYATKEAVGRHAGITKSPKRIRDELRHAVKEAALHRTRCKPYRKPGPFELKIVFTSTDLADQRNYDGQTSFRLDGQTALYRDEDLIRLLAKSM